MKRLLLMSVLLAAAAWGHCATSLHLVFVTADGAKHQFEAKSLVMKVESGSLAVSNGTESATLALADLSKMYFENAESGIVGVPVDLTGAAVEAYAVSGVHAGSFKSMAEAMSSLAPGVYLLKSDGKTLKVQVK